MRVCIAGPSGATLGRQRAARAAGTGWLVVAGFLKKKKMRVCFVRGTGAYTVMGPLKAKIDWGDCRGWKVARNRAGKCAHLRDRPFVSVCALGTVTRIRTIKGRGRCMHTYPRANGDGWPYPPAS